jgi:hypothetical protein
MKNSLALMTLGDFLPVAYRALDTVRHFGAGVLPVLPVLYEYKATCDKLTQAIQTGKDSLGQRA